MKMNLKILIAFGFLFFFTGIISGPGYIPEMEIRPVSSGKKMKQIILTSSLAGIEEPKKEKQLIRVEATAYSPPRFPSGKQTFSGKPVGWGVIAIHLQNNNLTLGSKVRFPGLFNNQVFCALDTLKHKPKKSPLDRVDIWLPSHYQAIQWGRKVIMAEIITETEVVSQN